MLRRPWVGRETEAELFDDLRGHKATPEVVSPLESPCTSLRGGERDEHRRGKAGVSSPPLVNVPAGRNVYGCDGGVGSAQLSQDAVKRRPHLPLERKTENSIHDEVKVLVDVRGEGGRVRDTETPSRHSEPLVERFGRGLRVADGHLVTEVGEVSRRNQAVSPIVPRAADDEHAREALERELLSESSRAAQTGQFHQLVNGESQRAHEHLVQLECLLPR
mmetsp:Transcript_13945/g.27636  ORF Transcript_13945/g.27636 Transcript_13945/m.27636 type:complete len:219 (+) Transcript_13945:1497-2153(+)